MTNQIMRASQITTLLLLSSFGLCAIRAADAVGPTRSNLENLFQSLVTTEGAAYFIIRSNLVEYGNGAVGLLEAKRTSRDLHERVLAAAVLSWIREAPTNYLRSELLRNLVREALRNRGDGLGSIQSLSFGVWGPKGPIQLRDALHEDAAVPFLLEVALKGPASVPANPLQADIASTAARCMATALVGGYQGPDVLPVLKELLQSLGPHIRVCAASGTGRNKTVEATELLIDALIDSDPRVRRTSRAALFDFTDQDFREDRVEWLKWWQQNKQRWPFNDRLPGHNHVPLWTHDK